MTDLTTLLRQHVEHDEPWSAPDPGPALDAGRRRLRSRRLLATTTVAAVLAVAAALAVPLLPGHGDGAGRGTGTGRGIDPATRRALADYDAQQMPRILDEHASRVFSRSVPDLPAAHFIAYDDQGQELPPKYYDKASGMGVRYGDGTDHRWSVNLLHARSEAEGDPRRICADSLEEGIYLECEVSPTPSGDLAVTRLGALRAGAGGWYVVTPEQLGHLDPDRVWFARDVEVVHSETFVTAISERVRAPTREAAEAAFDVPGSDLVELASDPALVIPPPPPGKNGCPAWVMPPMEVSCGSAG
jgi:hypothetical protein